MKFITTAIFFLLLYTQAFTQTVAYTIGQEIFSDDFTNGFNTTVWKTEMAPLPNSSIYIKNGQLVLDTKGGVTVWLRQPLSGNFAIEYKRKVLQDTGRNDRVSDLNTFWMATDPHNPNLFTRSGNFKEYDSLQMYYMGMGGNYNSTTRFRKYTGTGERKLIIEYTDSARLLQPNKEYSILIVVKDGTTQFIVDGEPYVIYNDPQPLTKGYFGFRSTKSRQVIDDFKIYRID